MENRTIGVAASVLDYFEEIIMMKTLAPSPAWIEKTTLLSKDDVERVSSKMRKKFTGNIKQKVTDPLVDVALQLHSEDEQLKEWRCMVAELRKRG
jgi:hypothetical protein